MLLLLVAELAVFPLRTRLFVGVSTSRYLNRLRRWVRSGPAFSYIRTLCGTSTEWDWAKRCRRWAQRSVLVRNITGWTERWSVESSPPTSSGWNGLYGMHRADLLTVLADALPPSAIRTGHRCVAFEQSAVGAKLTFANGEIVETDIVIAADGIQSDLQKYAIEPSVPEYSGSRAYRGLISSEKLPEWRKEAHQVWMGDGKHFMVFPVRSGGLLNYVGFVPTEDETIESWSAVGDRDELAASFAGWDPRVVGLLEKVETCFWWGLYDRKPLASWTKGRLALLGDAAHAMLPHVGQGANQAIEDGVALAVFLEGRDSAQTADALRRYETFRRERTGVVQAEARKNGLRYDSRYESLEQRDREIANAAEFRRWLYDYDVAQAANAHLSSLLA